MKPTRLLTVGAAAGLCALLALVTGVAHGAPAVAFPGEAWEDRAPGDLGLDPAKIDEIAEMLGGRGCVIRHGYRVKTWGEQDQRSDWLSSAKPVLSTLLLFAVAEGKVASVDQPIAAFGWDLAPKDRGITFRHLGAMVSGYARPEGPGEAWAYNDYAIQLYQRTLFDRVFQEDPKAMAEAPHRLGALGLEDGLEFTRDKRRIKASVRDFARIAWFWANRGRWGDRVLLPEELVAACMAPQVPPTLPHTASAQTADYLGIGSYGGGSDHFTEVGAGAYGFNWWFNGAGRLHPHVPLWPDAPEDAFMSIGAGGNCAAMMPGDGLVVVCAGGQWGRPEPGRAASTMNRVFALLGEAAGHARRVAWVTGDLRKWHPVSLSIRSQETAETAEPNPFTDYRMDVTFTQGDQRYRVAGYYAADGNAAETGADSGSVWRAHFTPDAEGRWDYRVSFRWGPHVAIADTSDAGEAVEGVDGIEGSFHVGPTDKEPPDFRGTGMLRYTGGRYLTFAESGRPYIKGGADSPENFLAFVDIDGTVPSHRYEPHARDVRSDDPTWRGGRGKNILGALNYLAGKGMNSVYFLTMNVQGDGKDVWPWTSDRERWRFDCSKLDQWEVVFRHMDRLGLAMHVVTQEQENDQLLDDGDLGPTRRLYYRELLARFAHHPALIWNLGEENTNTDAQRQAFAEHIRALDPYHHPIVVHTYPKQYDQVYTPLLGHPAFEGPSLQLADMRHTYAETLKWVRASAEAGRPWFVCQDEIGPPQAGVKPDADDPGHDEVRRYALWGNLMAGGAGSEWLFGYDYPHNDITCEDWRSRDTMWDQTRHALEFFRLHLPFTEMEPVPEAMDPERGWCMGKDGEVYAVYLIEGGTAPVGVPEGSYSVEWYDPRAGGELLAGDVVASAGSVELGPPPSDPGQDWAVLLRRRP